MTDPDAVLDELREGNRRFVKGRSTPRDWLAEAAATAGGQTPKAVVLGCIDSRVIPELLFDQGIGDLFVGRVAGNVLGKDLLGSCEYGTEVAGARLVVVLGHTACGAVKGAIDGAELGHLTGLLAKLAPAMDAVAAGETGRASADADYVDRVVEANVRHQVKRLTERSPVLAERVAAGSLRIVGAVDDLATGAVRWLD